MAGIAVTREDLEALGGQPITPARFDAVQKTVLNLIRGEYRRDVTLAEGRHADVLNAVFTSAALRLLTNPTGARSIGLGSANVTFGGSDSDVSSTATLTDQERTTLRRLRGARPTTVALTPYYGLPLYSPVGVDDLEGYEEVP